MNSVFDTLVERGFVVQCSDGALSSLLAQEKMGVYAGFDPTADSLHLGHLVPILALAHFQRAGHRVVLLVGGATAMVGDPSGKSQERQLLPLDIVAANVAAVLAQVGRFLDMDGDPPPLLVNNADWIGKMSFVDWLREVGKHFTVNYMLAKDSVRRRLEADGGITYTEFSYMTMQAYDFLHLFDHLGTRLQCGGSDQWGNITAGIELIRRLRQAPAYGLTFPLVTTASGEKFGKSAGNAVWLDPARTSPWELYQYLARQDDRDVVRLLNLYTFLPKAEIDELEASTQAAPEERRAQRRLAYEVTRLVHGEGVARETAAAADVVYRSEIKGLSDAALAAAFASAPSTEIRRSELDQGIDLAALLVQTGLSASKSEARRLLKAGGLYVNNVPVREGARLGREHLASESYIVLRSGKKHYHILRVR